MCVVWVVRFHSIYFLSLSLSLFLMNRYTLWFIVNKRQLSCYCFVKSLNFCCFFDSFIFISIWCHYLFTWWHAHTCIILCCAASFFKIFFFVVHKSCLLFDLIWLFFLLFGWFGVRERFFHSTIQFPQIQCEKCVCMSLFIAALSRRWCWMRVVYIISHLIRISLWSYTYMRAPPTLCARVSLCVFFCVRTRSTTYQFACMWLHECEKLGRDTFWWFLFFPVTAYSTRINKKIRTQMIMNELGWNTLFGGNVVKEWHTIIVEALLPPRQMTTEEKKTVKPSLCRVDDDVKPRREKKKKNRNNAAYVRVCWFEPAISFTICGSTINVTVTVTDAPDNVMRM